MQYDENGYPIKGNSSTQNSNSYGSAPTAAATSSSAATAYPSHQPNPSSPYQPREASLMYDEQGHPIKPQPQIPQQQQHRNQQQQQAQSGPRYDENGYPIKQQNVSGNTQPAYAQQGGGNANQNRDYPSQTGAGSPDYAYNNNNNGYNNNNVYNNGIQPSQGSYQPYGQQLPEHNYWTTGLCDMCADCDICMEGCCCMCCQEGRVYEAVSNNTPNTMSILACCISFWCFEFPFVDLYNRRKLIEKYNIQDEGCCTSLCFSWFCPCLSICQMQRELQARGMYPGGQCCAPSHNPKSPAGHQSMGGRGYGQQSL